MERQLAYIKSYRNCVHAPSFSTVYEWEDILSSELNLKILKPNKFKISFISRVLRKLGFVNLYHKLVIPQKRIKLLFAMQAATAQNCLFDKNTIVVIIDFWLSESELDDFYQTYKNCPLLLVTNLEVYEFLIQNNCPIPVEHWPLSIPDSVEVFSLQKKYDFCFIGRKDPFFVEMIEKYASSNNGFTYITSNDDIENRKYFTNRGEFVMKDEGRSTYLQLIRETKICSYSTPGYDKAKFQTEFFNQVTPRVLEMISGGCYVLGHYPENYDTRYYNLKSVVPQIETYDDFKFYMDLYLNAPDRDIKECKEYVNKHNTTSRIPLLIKILNKYNIIV